MAEAIGVFIDWQNAYKSAREAFNLGGLASERGNFSPYRLAQILAAGNERGGAGNLVRVEVHRGLPSNRRDPVGYGANRKQAAAWMRENEEVVIPRLRPLRYDPGDPDAKPEEKGIDVSLAVGAVEQVLTNRCDVAIIFTNDTDIAPAVELIARLVAPSHVETASWTSHHYETRLRPITGVYHHKLSGRVFQQVETPINYAYKGNATSN
jgi:uncharacterized LabA/DUF88 family protein